MQVSHLDFLVASIKCIRGAGEAQPCTLHATFSRHEAHSCLATDSAPQVGESGGALQPIERCFASTLQDLEDAVNRVKKLAQIQSSFSRVSGEVLSAAKQRCLMLPGSRATRTFDRPDVFQKLDQILDATVGGTFEAVALHSIGGVGKSTIASAYVEAKFDESVYDVVLWAHGEKTISLRQSFTDIALRLQLPGAQPQAHDENLVLV